MNTPTTYKLVLEGPNGREFLLNQPELLVGRDPAAQIVIPTPAISRNHARLRWTEAGYTLEDLDSSNGSFVNEQRLPANQPFLLQPDQAVRFGQAVRLRYVVLNPSASIGGLSDATVSESLASNPTELEPFGAAPTPSAGGTLVVPEPPVVQPAKPLVPQLIWQIGQQASQTFDLTQTSIRVGRNPDNDLVIASPVISRYHAKLTQAANGGYRLEVLANASNPALLAGKPVRAAYLLQTGDVLKIGEAYPEHVVQLTYKAVLPVVESATLVAPAPTPATLVAPPPKVEPSAPVEPHNMPTVSSGLGAGRPGSDLSVLPTMAGGMAVPPAPQPVPAVAGPSDATVIGGLSAISGMPSSSDFRLQVSVAGEAPLSYPLTAARVTIGRATDNYIRINSPIVSRHHATLERQGESYTLVVEPEAGNPVYSEGRPIVGKQLLKHNDKLRIGGQDPGMMVTLQFIAPALAAVSLPTQALDFSTKSLIAIGRDSSNDVVLDSPLVSRYHAQVERVGQRFRITDLHSGNGTFVNNQQISTVTWLNAEDQIRIGPHNFQVSASGLMQQAEVGGLRVEVEHLNKWVRKDLNILKDISLAFEPSEFVVVVGQSGGGKSTLVDAISGYRPATHGHVRVNGIDVYKNFDAIRNDIGFVPQRDIIHMELTVYQALDYAAQLRMPSDTSKQERHKRILEVLRDLDLEARKDTQISSLSGGQQKRVSIGVELITKPGLFFLDEPTSGLDPGTETEVMQLMRRLADQGRTIILITHATKNVMLADKVVFLARGGYLAWFGAPDEAFTYFDPYRSERERRAKSIEFDEIYAILNDKSKGTPADWGKRYQESAYYQKYVVQGLAKPDAPVVKDTKSGATLAAKPQPKRKTSALRQFGIFSNRNLTILSRDKFALALMLLTAPIVSLLDFVLMAIMGRGVLSFETGSIENTMMTLFLPSVYAVMVGAISQMREIVKEQDIYKRERLVNLRIFPYIMSKIWVAALLALFQALVYTVVQFVAFDIPVGMDGFVLMYLSLALATMAGMMLGLFASAIAPNANSAPLIVILLVIPQIVLAGALFAVPPAISSVISTRWGFQAWMAIAGAGSDVAADSCWQLPASSISIMSDEQKANCRCMGVNVLDKTSCNFPGVGKFAVNLDKTITIPPDPGVEPTQPPKPVFPTPPAEPVVPSEPVKPADESDQVAMAGYFQEMTTWQDQVQVIQAQFQADTRAFQAKVDTIQAQSEQEFADFQIRLNDYRLAKEAFVRANADQAKNRASAIAPAEAVINKMNKNFGWLFVDKESPKYWTTLVNTWGAQSAIIFVLFVGTLIAQWRKDKVQ